MPNWKKLITSGSAASLSSLSLDTALPVSEGGTGATTLTSNGILTGNGTSAIQAEANLTFDASSNLNLLSDSGKLRIGAGNNLEIYHNGTNDFIDSGGTAIFFRQGTTEKIKFNSAGNIQFNNAQADINTRFGTTGSTNTLWIDGGTDRVGVGTNSPGYKLDVSGDYRFKDTAAGGALLGYHHNDSDNGLVLLAYGSSYSAGTVLSVGANGTAYDHSNNVGIDAGSSSFIALGVGGSEKMRVHTDGNIGIGVSSPEQKMHIFGDAPFLKIENNTEDASGIIMEDAQDPGQNGRIVYDSGANKLYLQAHGGTGFEMDSSRDIKINESLGIGVAANGTTGRLDCSNDVVAFSTSDERLKENIKPLDSALDKVLKISGVSFDWKELTEEEKKTIHGNEGHDIGVIAQEIEEVLPEVVTERDNGYKAVKYEKIVPLLIESIKELKQEVDEIKQKCDCLNN